MYINTPEENKTVVTIEVLSEKLFKQYIFSFIGNFEHLQTN